MKILVFYYTLFRKRLLEAFRGFQSLFVGKYIFTQFVPNKIEMSIILNCFYVKLNIYFELKNYINY